MADKRPARKGTRKPSSATAARDKVTGGFTEDERAAMRERAKELKAARRSRGGKADEESAVLAKIAEMSEPDRTMAERVHALVRATAPELAPKLWYGMPAYAKDGAVVCFFQGAQKFKTRYSTLGFTDKAMLDDGPMWPTAFALMELTSAVETRVSALVRKACEVERI
jgi:uncharacterized protein YdhG (YjbR/CyaY superfamily)